MSLTFILVEPSHPGNIGAAARAMKVMGLTNLSLVNPNSFPSASATAMAAGADDVLASAKVFTSLDTAIQDMQLVLGTSARSRKNSLELLTPSLAAKKLAALTSKANCAVVFGRESSGLTNEELAKCNGQIVIPTASSFSSLNLAAAVQVISYEYFKEASLKSNLTKPSRLNQLKLASHQEIAHLVSQFSVRLIKRSNAADAARLNLKLTRILNKAQLESSEAALLEGVLKCRD